MRSILCGALRQVRSSAASPASFVADGEDPVPEAEYVVPFDRPSGTHRVVETGAQFDPRVVEALVRVLALREPVYSGAGSPGATTPDS